MAQLAPKTEKAAEVTEGAHETRAPIPGFEPEILAFCCEH
jgi:hypothetical protein